ncbi:glycosyltransferase family 2 protein [Asaia sp. HN010]|uniref:glycosyltransferase n=1 Tax=Asaia sp. HN010 TaxID=3081233 RepID=UPI00301B2CBA
MSPAMHAIEGKARHRAEMALTALAVFPLVLGLLNLRALSRAPRRAPSGDEGVSVLIPARNEAGQIKEALAAIIANGPIVREIIVLDDHSSDDTVARIREVRNERIRIVSGEDLPSGWCGKSHACAQLARQARHGWLLFLDADVRLAPDAVARLMAGTEDQETIAFISGVPHQETRSFLEWLLLPFINVLLFGYLPLPLDQGRSSGLAAACGQLVLVKAQAYHAAGGHEAIGWRLHDGLALARSLRQHGFRTRLIDATDLAHCRMYRNAGEVYAGLMKNAVEGLAGPVALPVWTTLLAGGHILPFLLRASPLMKVARAASLALRLLVALRCRQGVLTVLFSPLGTLLLLWIQFHARLRHMTGRPVTWKGRLYET